MARHQRLALFAVGERCTAARLPTRWKRLLLLTAALFVGGAVALPVPPALAATFTANSTTDEPDLDLSDGLCATAAGDCTLRAAVQQANALGGGPHTIALLAGATYTLTRTGAGEDAAARGDLDLATALTISVPGGRAVVRAASGFGDRVFYVLSGVNVELNGLEIKDGQSFDGGGIFIDFFGTPTGGTLTLTNSTVSGNSAARHGGGIVNAGTLTLTNSTVSGNRAGGSVGGIWNTGEGTFNIGALTLTNSTVSGNSAPDGFAGGIYNEAGTLTVTKSTVSGNSAGFGGGLVNGFEGATLTLTNSTVSGNSSGAQGGGIRNFGTGTLTVTNSTVSGNSAGSDGGGLISSSQLTITNSTVSGNSAGGDGGGIWNRAKLTLTNSTISGNSALADGGGIRNEGTVTANNLTIAKNVADANADDAGNGGGVFNVFGGTVRVANTIIGTNADRSRTILAARQAPDCVGSLTSRGYSLVQTTTGCTIGGDTTGNITGRDPKLGPLQDNGGPTFTHALIVVSELDGLTFASPAIDVGNPGRGIGILCASTDQRGVGRPLDGNADDVARCDIGAYEYVPPPFKLGTLALTPAEATVRPGERLTYELTWTVPPPLGWRSLDTLELRFLDDRGTALWVRFQEIAGFTGLFGVVDPRNGNAGPPFAPGNPNRLESEFATVYLAGSSVDGPPGPRVTVTLMLSFKPHAAGRTYDVLVGATDDAGEVQGFHRAGSVAVTG